MCTPMFIAVLFIIARTWKQPRCPSADKWIRKLWYIYTMIYYSAVKKNAFESVLMRWMKLEPIMRRQWQPTPVLLPGKSRGQRSLEGCSPQGHWGLDMTERLHFTFHFHALEKEMATHSSVLAWRIPGTGEPSGLPSMGSHRVGYDWIDLAVAAVDLQGQSF